MIYAILIVIAIFVARSYLKHKVFEIKRKNYEQNAENINGQSEESEIVIVNRILQDDKNYNLEEFKNWSNNILIRLKEAWIKRDCSNIQLFESSGLLLQHQTQINGFLSCGALIELAAVGKCEYCGSVITTEKFGWILNQFEEIN